LAFAWHRQPLEQLHRRLSSYGAALITGATPATARSAAVRRLQAGEIRVLVAQIAAGGTAITATAARRVCFLELAWTPSLNWQSSKRAHRVGQHHPVMVDVLSVPGSIDSAVLELLNRKSWEIAELEREAAA
jgi:SNF2 family DNA or RNA helicase